MRADIAICDLGGKLIPRRPCDFGQDMRVIGQDQLPPRQTRGEKFMPKRLHLYDYLSREIELLEDVFENMYKEDGDIFTEKTDDELQSDAFDAADSLSMLLEGQDLNGIARKAVEVAVWNLVIARYARVTGDELKKKKESKGK